MGRHSLKIGCSLLALAALGACSDDDKNSQAVVVTPAGPPQLNSFGSQFATAFKADPNSNPYVPADGDVPALTLNMDSVAID